MDKLLLMTTKQHPIAWKYTGIQGINKTAANKQLMVNTAKVDNITETLKQRHYLILVINKSECS